LSYKLEIKTIGNNFVQDLVHCDGENNALIRESTGCYIPVATLRAAPWYLGDQASIFARVTAIN